MKKITNSDLYCNTMYFHHHPFLYFAELKDGRFALVTKRNLKHLSFLSFIFKRKFVLYIDQVTMLPIVFDTKEQAENFLKTL